MPKFDHMPAASRQSSILTDKTTISAVLRKAIRLAVFFML